MAITSMTVGFGDITPVTNAERLYVTIIAFCLVGMFVHVINMIGSIVQRFQE
jgi:hypothetical protein